LPRPRPRRDATIGDKIDDASITAQVKSSLLSHHSTSAMHTGVSTTDGVVTVTGIAKNDAEKASSPSSPPTSTA
jgi:hyperosmotically inducible protein